MEKVSISSEVLCFQAFGAAVWFFGLVLIEVMLIIYYNELLLFM
jgi:hypothetical protein